VSVVIATFNRPEQLRRTLECLAAQTLAASRFEVVVIDDGSRVPYDGVLSHRWPFRLQYRRQENQGEIMARVCGVQLSRSPFVAFLDDDILPEPSYLAELLAEHANHPGCLILGTLYPKVGEPPTPFQLMMVRQDGGQRSGQVPFYECWSGVLSVERSVIDSLGGLRTLGHGGRNAWGGLDVAFRAAEKGISMWRTTRAVAYHDDFAIASVAAYSKRMRSVSRMAVLNFQRCPRAMSAVPMFRDKTPIRLGEDPLLLIGRKVARRLASTACAMAVMNGLVGLTERAQPASRFLPVLYRWIIGGAIYQGYREGQSAFGPTEAR
jgi:glycosyltransferase involved in cell wall biosynthesis